MIIFLFSSKQVESVYICLLFLAMFRRTVHTNIGLSYLFIFYMFITKLSASHKYVSLRPIIFD